MAKVTLIIAGFLLMASNVFADNSVDTKALVKAMTNLHQHTGADKGSFAIVYGGEDISRGNNAIISRAGNTVLVG
jgi:hypothetical protein